MSAATLVVIGIATFASAQTPPAVEVDSSVHAGQAPARPAPVAPGRAAARTPSPSRQTPTGQASARARVQSVAGEVIQTAYGPVQVEVSLRSGQITRARALARPSGDGQTDAINGYAVPKLDQETLAAQSSRIDTVSGATFTSEGYRQSLQSALDAAHGTGAR